MAAQLAAVRRHQVALGRILELLCHNTQSLGCLMNEAIVAELIRLVGAVLGGFLGAYGSIRAAKIDARKEEESGDGGKSSALIARLSPVLGATIGLVMGVVIVSLLWQGGILSTKGVAGRCSDLGIKILAPDDRDEVPPGEKFDVVGVFSSEPSLGELQLFVLATDRTDYWPQDPVVVDVEEKSWSGEARIDDEAYLIAAIIGDSVRSTVNYYFKVGRESGMWFPIDGLAGDIDQCDRLLLTTDS